MAVGSGIVEYSLVQKVSNAFNKSVSNYFYVMLVFSPGMFIAAPSFIPSSWAMVFVTWAALSWFEYKTFSQIYIFVMLIGIASLVGWPFAGVMGIPFLLKCMFESRFSQILGSAIVFLILIMVNHALGQGLGANGID